MSDGQPLPVKFYAACALELVLREDTGRSHIRSGLDQVLKTYLKLMNELDSEELVAAFENIMSIFANEIQPFATDICNHLMEQYKRLVKVEDDEDGESLLAAVASFTSMRRIIDACSNHKDILAQLEQIIYPCILHSLTPDGLDSIEEGIDCTSMLIHYGYVLQPENVPQTNIVLS